MRKKNELILLRKDWERERSNMVVLVVMWNIGVRGRRDLRHEIKVVFWCTWVRVWVVVAIEEGIYFSFGRARGT